MAISKGGRISVKQLGIDKANTRIVATAAIAAFVVIFCLVGSVSLIQQLGYQNRIISAKKQAVSQLKKNLVARDSLVTSYKSFAGSDQNFLGGSAGGSGALDGNNAKLVLDALPATYDFPALASSLEKLADDQQLIISELTGVDETSAQAEKNDGKAVPMAFDIKASGSYDNIQKLIGSFDRSIRPVQIQKLTITGDTNGVGVDVAATTYYQPEKSLDIQSKVVK